MMSQTPRAIIPKTPLQRVLHMTSRVGRSTPYTPPQLTILSGTSRSVTHGNEPFTAATMAYVENQKPLEFAKGSHANEPSTDE